MYRYGFNGKYKDNEWAGIGNHLDYGFRGQDTRTTRFISIDPLTKKYPYLTPYQFASNSPISGKDLDGKEYYYSGDGNLQWTSGKSTEVMLVNDKYVNENKGKRVNLTQLNSNSKDVGMTNKELNTRAFLSSIKQTENGGHSPLPYNAWNGYENGKLITFTDKSYKEAPKDYSAHPGMANSGSSAAGAYQILKPSFNNYRKIDDDITDFSPISQDKIAMDMIDYRHALEDIANGDLQSASTKLTKRDGGEQFASLPGGSQSNVTIGQLKSIFKKNVSNELNGQTNVGTPVGDLTK